MNMCARTIVLSTALMMGQVATAGDELTVVSVDPPARIVGAARNASISITFDEAVNPATVNSASFWAFAQQSGSAEGTITLSNGNQTMTLTPDEPFAPGESVTVYLSHDLAAADGSPMRGAGYSYRFWVRSRHACMDYTLLDEISNLDKGEASTRIYGTVGTDLNNDGAIDLATINENSADIRVFLNRDDGSGLFHPWLQPPAPALRVISPNDSLDFNRDGFTDICAASTYDHAITLQPGNGDGTFDPHIVIPVGNYPAGITTLDANGDGHVDLATSNYSSGDCCIALNLGEGSYEDPTFFEGGGSGEYSICSADMNNDGIMDLIVGAKDNQRVIIHLANGDGTYSISDTETNVGQVWQMGAGDVNGDGNEDIHTGNSFSDTGTILIGNGLGQFVSAIDYPSPGDPVSTDLADFDGDNDLDWVMATFVSGQWHIYRNNGAGAFTFNQSIPAPSNGSCATPLDLDGDLDLDLALADEIADIVTLMEATNRAGDLNCDGLTGIADLLGVIGDWGACNPAPAPCSADLTMDGVVGIADLLLVIGDWGT